VDLLPVVMITVPEEMWALLIKNKLSGLAHEHRRSWSRASVTDLNEDDPLNFFNLHSWSPLRCYSVIQERSKKHSQKASSS